MIFCKIFLLYIYIYIYSGHVAHIESKTIQSLNILENKLYIYIYIIKILKYFPSNQFF